MGFSVQCLVLPGVALPGVAGFIVRVGDLFSFKQICSAPRALSGPGLHN